MTLEITTDKLAYKCLFTLKAKQRDGQVLNIHRSDKTLLKTRFIHATFSHDGQTLVVADNNGNIFAIDFAVSKFWNVLATIESCTVLKFSTYKDCDILVGNSNGLVSIINIETGCVSGQLIGHRLPVISVSFHQKLLSLTSSKEEAIIWDLTTDSKAHVLRLNKNCGLRQVVFMPVTGNILACFDDDVIQVWKYGTFDDVTLLQPQLWNGHSIKNAVFGLNGQTMVLALHPAHLALFFLNNWKLSRLITLPEQVQTIKHAEFIPNLVDGGCNNTLALLSGQGTIYFYNIEQNVVLSELASCCALVRYHCSSKGNYIACVLSSGDVTVYDYIQYVVSAEEKTVEKAHMVGRKVKLKSCLKKISTVKEEIRDILDLEKLRLILREFGEFPDVYRTKIWEQLLDLPNNRHSYNSIINHRLILSFKDLHLKYGLENKRNAKNLRRLLDNLVTWSPFFAHVPFLPVFVFPFVKVFHNNPLVCFEAVCTVIVNWCQFWFEYFPLPPINILAIIENVLMEHDPELLYHLARNNAVSKLYAWPLLETLFSEVLTAPQWKTFWDHVLTNEPAFLLCAVVAYNIIQRVALLGLEDEKRFVSFYQTHHPVDVKKLLAKTYFVMNNTSDENHPRQFLSSFQKLRLGEYPEFCAYPKAVVDYRVKKNDAIEGQLQEMEEEEGDLISRRIANLKKLDNFETTHEERQRIFEMERVVKQQVIEEQHLIEQNRQRLSQLKDKLLDEEEQILKLSRNLTEKNKLMNRGKLLKSLIDDITVNKRVEENKSKKAEDLLLLHYSELLRHKYTIERLFEEKTGSRTNFKPMVQQHQQELAEEIAQVKHAAKSQKHLKVLNIATGIAAMNALMAKVEEELCRTDGPNGSDANLRVLKLKAETGELVVAINKLLRLLAEVKSEESNK